MYRRIIDWSEVWALLIPLLIILLRRKNPSYLKPVRYYIFAALLLNISVDIILLFYCMQFYLYLLQEDRIKPLKSEPSFWVVSGLTLYVAVNFFIFLFYTNLIMDNEGFSIIIWDVHNISYIILCTCIAKAFYE